MSIPLGQFAKITGLVILVAWLAIVSSLAGPPLSGDLVSDPPAGRQEAARIAKGGGGFLTVWVDTRAALAEYLGPNGPFDGPGLGSMEDIYAARLDAAGNLLDTTPIVISQRPYNQNAPLVGWNGENWLVVWMTERETDRYVLDVMMARVAPGGQVLDDPPLVLNAGISGISHRPFSISSDGTNWVVVWQGIDATAGIWTIDGARVSPAGVVLDPAGKSLRHDSWNSGATSASLAFAGDVYLLTWIELDSATIDWVVKGQRLNLSLDPIGTPFLVNTYLPSSAGSPRVSSDGTTFLVVWFEDRYYGWAQLYGTRVSHAGTVLDPNGIAITPTAGYSQFSPDVCWDGSNYVVSYNMEGTGFDEDIFVTRVTATGAVLDPSGILVKGGTLPQAQAAVAPRAGGGAQVVWTDSQTGGREPRDIATATITAAGAPGVSSSISRGAPRQSLSRLASGGSGYLVVFRSETSGQSRIVAKRLDASGNELDAEPLEIASGANGYLTNPSVAWNGSEFLVVWQDASANAFRGQIFARRVRPNGTLLDASPISIMPGTRPDVAALGSTFLVVADDVPTNPHFRSVYASRVTSAGAVLGGPVFIGASFSFSARVAALGGRWLVVWEVHPSHDDAHAGVAGAFVGADGAPTAAFGVSDGGTDYTPHLAVAGGSALIAWSDGNISARRIMADGTLVGPAAGLVISAAPNSQFQPAVAWDGAQYVVAWLDHRNDSYPNQPRGDIYGTRVDVNGNVLDPVGFAIAASPAPEENPAVAAAAGTTMLGYTGFIDRAPYSALRVALRRFPFDLDFQLSCSPPAQTVAPGGTTSYVVTVVPAGDFAGTVSFGVYGLPPGVTASFNPTSVAGSGLTTMTVNVGQRTAEEIYSLTIVGSNGPQQTTLAVTLVVSIAPPSVRYAVTDLGTLGGTASEAWGINDIGQVVGKSKLAGGLYHAFVFTNGAMTDLGTLGGTASAAYGINNAGQIAGLASKADGSSHAFRYSGGVMQDLGTFGGGTEYSAAYGINSAGSVAGWAEFTLRAGPHAFLSGGGPLQDLGSLGGYWSYAFDVNTSGQVAGYASDSIGYARAFLYGGGVLLSLGTLSGDVGDSEAYGLNDAAQVVGASNRGNNTPSHAALWSGGGVTDLGTLGGTTSLARSINGSGQIVGYSLNASAVSRAFLCESGTMLNLNSLIPADSGWTLSEARGINEFGQIVGVGTVNGATHGFLLSPANQQNVPGEVGGTRFGEDKSTFYWGAAAATTVGVLNDVMRGVLAELPVGSGVSETCLVSNLAGTNVVDPDDPGAGRGFYYLVRAKNSGGAGTYGSRSNGIQRPSVACP